jgi:uncharacterized protein YbjT (DUF2867 family)
MKKILIIGANGKVGRILTEKFKIDPAFTPFAFIRNNDQARFFKEMGVDHILGSVEGTVESIAKAMTGMDAIIFTAGSGGNTGYDKTLSVDLDGAVKTMEAALKANVKRYVMVSAIHADNREAWDVSKIKPYYIAKHYADRILKTIGLDYTILRPGRLLDEPGTGNINTTNPEAQKQVPREDVAMLVVEVLKHDNTIGKIIKFNEGETPIREVLQSL